jgi:pyruvate dehydrogenase E2 component (dihydrolipoamide acetyltransferase)
VKYEMKMPDLATTDSAIRVVRWAVEVGQRVSRGQTLLEIETDKSTMDVESVVTGVLSSTAAQVDDSVSVGQLIATFEIEGDTPAAVPALSAPSTAGVASPVRSTTRPAAVPAANGATAPKPAGGMFARNRQAAAPVPAGNLGRPADIALSVAHRTAARRLTESKQTIPHFYLQASINAGPIAARRTAAEPVRLAWDAFFVRAAAIAMERFPRMRYRFEGDKLVAQPSDAIGVAVDHDGDLYVVAVDGPREKSVEQISNELRSRVEQLRASEPEARRIRPTCLTITNLGMTCVQSFVPIINPPEAAILGIGRVAPVPVARDNGRIAIERRATLTLAVDHRVVSGRYAADFFAAMSAELETP